MKCFSLQICFSEHGNTSKQTNKVFNYQNNNHNIFEGNNCHNLSYCVVVCYGTYYLKVNFKNHRPYFKIRISLLPNVLVTNTQILW